MKGVLNMVDHVAITPTKNRCELLKRAISSVANQAEQWRHIIINDGSIDSTRAYLDQFVRQNEHVVVLNREKSGGMQAAQNMGIELVQEHELASFLDDDDYMTSDATAIITQAAKEAPEIEVFFFNTYKVTPSGTYEQGIDFAKDELFFEPSYYDVMTKQRLTGDCHMVWRGSICVAERGYRYAEDINGFPYELLIRMARDGVRIRYVHAAVKNMDRLNMAGHLSKYDRTKAAPFVRANVRIFSDHAVFFTQHPRLSMDRAIAAMKVAVQARDVSRVALFSLYYLRSAALLVLGKREKDE